MPDPFFTVHVISHTHWDREWYLPLSGFRPKLVKAIDRLFQILAKDPGFIFHLDGQVILLEDYLELRPEKEALLREYVRQGRIIIGPWYTMPDEFLPSPESLYRNLRLGFQRGSRFGPVMKVGYLPDPFGQTGQMWQLLRKYGIEWAVFKRGMNLPPAKVRSEVRLISPDGSSVLGAYMVHSYTNARAFGTVNRPLSWISRRIMPVLRTVEPPERRADGLRDWIFCFLSCRIMFWLTHVLVTFEDASLRPKLVETEAGSLKALTTGNHILFMHGGDHRPPRTDTGAAIQQANSRRSEYRLVQGTMEGYFKAVAGEKDLPEIAGEMRSGRYDPVLPGVISTRMYLKQTNHRVENLAEKWAFPSASLAAVVTGKEYPREPLDQGSRLLVMNHAHDSICGTSVDEVHREMMDRYRRSEALFEGVTCDSLDSIARRVDTTSIRAGETGLIVFNPSPRCRTGIVFYQTASGPGSRAVFDSEGKSVPAQADREGVYFQAEVPPLGYRLFRVAAGKPLPPPVTASGNRLENEHLIVEIGADGSFFITNKADSKRYGPLGYFEDSGDAGDSYNHSPPETDTTISSLGDKAEITALYPGPLIAGARVRLQIRLPERLDFRARKRSRKLVPVNIESVITLQAHAPVVRVHTEFDNTIKDHRLRVMFPTGTSSDVCYAEGQWEVVERGIAAEPPLDLKALKATGKVIGAQPGGEAPAATQPHRRFIDMNDGQAGLAVISSGLPEYEVLTDSTRAVALTLLRCTGWLSRSSLATRRGFAGPVKRLHDLQCPGKHSFDYAVMPHVGTWQQAGIPEAADNFDVPYRVLAVEAHPGTLPPEKAFLSLEPATLELSGMEMSVDDKLLVRVCNLSGERTIGRLSCGFAIKSASLVDFTEKLLASLTTEGAVVRFEAGPHEVCMLSLEV